MHICLLGRANKQRRSNLRLVCACIRICYYYGMAFVFILCWHFKINVLIKLHSTICGNKMPTRCNWGFYYKSYCFLNMFRAPLCPLSGAQEYYAVVAACGISCCGFQVAGLVWSWPVNQHPANRTHNTQLHTRPATWKLQHEIPQAATTV